MNLSLGGVGEFEGGDEGGQKDVETRMADVG